MIPRHPLAVIVLFFCYLALSALPVTGQEQVLLAAIHCPHCGAEVIATAKFCPKCGHQMPEMQSVQRAETPVSEEAAAQPAPLRQPAPAEQAAAPAEELVKQPAAQAEENRTRAVPESTMKSIALLPDVGKKPMEIEPSAAPPEENILARTMYQTGLTFYEQGAFLQAADRFSELQMKHPQSRYAEDARIMAKVCRGLDAIEKKMDAKSGHEKHTGTAFGAGFLGGVISIIAFVLLILSSYD